MKKITTTITYRVPVGPYCNHKLQKTTPRTRCRFCTEISKGNYTCVLHNDPLAIVGGALIEKCDNCMHSNGDIVEAPPVDAKVLVKQGVEAYRTIFQSLRNQGVPEALADKMAREEALK